MTQASKTDDIRALARAVEAIVGKGNVVSHPDDLVVYEFDGSTDPGIPSLVALPSTTEQVSRVVSLAYQHGAPVIPRGAGTGLSGGAVAPVGGIQIALTRMRRILEIDSRDQTALVEPGVVNLQVSNAARQYGLRYTPDPSSQKACTIGGNVSENAGGPHCLRYGVTTNHVLGLEVVLENGSVLWLGGKAQDAPGYDLVGAFVGGEGTLGVATKALLRLSPSPEAVRTYLAVFRDIDEATSAVSAVIAAGMVPAALEMIDAVTIKAVERARKMGYPTDAGAVLLIEIEGLREEVAEEGAEVERLCRQCGARELRIAEDAEERERLWAGRKGALGALGTLGPNYYLADGVVPRTKLMEVLRKVNDIGRSSGLAIANVLHAGDGNLHPCIVFDQRRPGELERAVAAGDAILKVCLEAGGVLSGEHGVGIQKREQMLLQFTEDDLTPMRWLKDAFSPRGLMNPMKVFPTHATHSAPPRPAVAGSHGPDAWL